MIPLSKCLGRRLLGFIALFFAASLAAENIPSELSWAERMALSDIKRNPQAWQIDFRQTPKWNYTHGLMMSAYEQLYKKTGNPLYLNYMVSYADTLINEQGEIQTYRLENYNIDHLNPGKFLLFLNQVAPKPRYQKALNTLYQQLQGQPRTQEGGFWHKQRYPWQIWLDGLYMGAPFYAQYLSQMQPESSAFDDIQLQFSLVIKHHRDAKTGLLFHGWDESRQQKWADPLTGLSANFWSRSIGWYLMGLVDTIEFLPQQHSGRQVLANYLKEVLDAVLNYQDAKSGLWYQVTDQGARAGNYIEATGSAMFIYAMAKGANRGYLPASYRTLASQAYAQLLAHLIRVDSDDGEVHLTQNCVVAGLGGKPYRSGSYDYYISEPIRDNDPKGVAPFILASLELNQ